MSRKDKFCAGCGAQNINFGKAAETLPSDGKAVKAVKRVYYDKDRKPIKNPNVKTNSEAAMQGLMIACIAIAVIIVTIAGSMFISGNLLSDTFTDKSFSPSVSDGLSEESVQAATSSEPPVQSDEAQTSEVSSDVASASEVSSVPDELLAVNMKQKIVGQWETELPYKSMSMPATFTFDDDGKCTCTIKALFISQKFEGTYQVEDGGKCAITLNGIEEYMNGNSTVSGDARFISDSELEFTSNGTVWNLKKAS